jgi:hypothetical protein
MTKELKAKALEIAIALTGANHEWLRTDEFGKVFLRQPLFDTLQTVIRFLNNSYPDESPGYETVLPEVNKT